MIPPADCLGCGKPFGPNTFVESPLIICAECGCIQGIGEHGPVELNDREKAFFGPIVDTINEELQKRRRPH